MCGIVGVFGHSAVSSVIYEGLSMLQHRGQDAAGIATYFEGRFYLEKGNGLLTDVFKADNMARHIVCFEDIREQAIPLLEVKPALKVRRNAGGILAAMLKHG